MWAFYNIEDMHSLYFGEYCVKKFCIFLREHATNAINFGKKKMLLITVEELRLDQDSDLCYICRKKICTKSC